MTCPQKPPASAGRKGRLMPGRSLLLFGIPSKLPPPHPYAIGRTQNSLDRAH